MPDHHYLPDDRLQWWGARTPDTGFIETDVRTSDELWLPEFSSLLGTIVGTIAEQAKRALHRKDRHTKYHCHPAG